MLTSTTMLRGLNAAVMCDILKFIMTTLSFQDIGLKSSQLRAAEKKAKEQGKTLSEYVRSLIERDLLASRSFDEILKPVREGFKKSGMTEDELDALVSDARKNIHARNKRKARK